MALSSERLAEIAERLKAATPGPWHEDPGSDWVMGDLASEERFTPIVFGGHSDGDLAFIANAPADITDLLSANVELTQRLGRIEAERVAIQNDRRVVTCVFCGHEYPPGTPSSNHEALKAHVAICPDHPAAAFRSDAQRLREQLEKAQGALKFCERKAASGVVYDGPEALFAGLEAANEITALRDQLERALKTVLDAHEKNRRSCGHSGIHTCRECEAETNSFALSRVYAALAPSSAVGGHSGSPAPSCDVVIRPVGDPSGKSVPRSVYKLDPTTSIFGSGSVLGAIASGEVNGYRYIMQLKALVDQMQAEIDRATVDGGELLVEIGRLRAKLARVERNNRMTVDTPKAYYPSVARTDGYSQAFHNGVAHKQADIDAALRDEPPVGAAK